MALFLSRFENKVDTKGRVSVPSQFRSMLYGQDFSGIVLYPSYLNNCIEGSSIERIQKFSEAIDDLDPTSRERDAFATVMLSEACQLPFDTDGRVILPKHLMELAGITDKAVFVGKGQTFEVWEPKKFEEYKKEAQERIKDMPFPVKKVSQ